MLPLGDMCGAKNNSNVGKCEIFVPHIPSPLSMCLQCTSDHGTYSYGAILALQVHVPFIRRFVKHQSHLH